MKGTKYLSDLITDPSQIKPGYINILEANVSGGKTTFALNTLPKWAGSAEKVLFLIDTLNGENRILLQHRRDTICRQDYSFCDYGRDYTWGEPPFPTKDRMPVMTYAGFGTEVINSVIPFWNKFTYIVCDEIQNLIKYQTFGDKNEEKLNLLNAEKVLRQIAQGGKAAIIGMSATPQAARNHFSTLCRDIPYDHTNLVEMETFNSIPYSGSPLLLLPQYKGKTGILYTSHIKDMKKYITEANQMGIVANGFWSSRPETQRNNPFSPEQRELQQYVLENESIPPNINLLVLNAASETSIKIQGSKRPITYMIVHDANKEVQTQVRGRYHGDLQFFHYHVAADSLSEIKLEVPKEFLNRPLYKEDRDLLCSCLNIRKPNDSNYQYKWTKIKDLLQNEYKITSQKDRAKGGKYFYVISPK